MSAYKLLAIRLDPLNPEHFLTALLFCHSFLEVGNLRIAQFQDSRTRVASRRVDDAMLQNFWHAAACCSALNGIGSVDKNKRVERLLRLWGLRFWKVLAQPALLRGITSEANNHLLWSFNWNHIVKHSSAGMRINSTMEVIYWGSMEIAWNSSWYKVKKLQLLLLHARQAILESWPLHTVVVKKKKKKWICHAGALKKYCTFMA